MVFRRGSALVAALAALACTVVLLGDVSAATPAAAVDAKAAAPAAARSLAAARTVGKPPANLPTRPASVFSMPNRGKKTQRVIRKRILNTINSTWGGPRTRKGVAYRGNGRIRIATWTFQDAAIARALYRAHRRGVSVQVIAAKKPNRNHHPWKWLRQRLKSRLYLPGHKETRNQWSFARHCYGSCRGPGGTPHAKYLLFSNVGYSHVPRITMQTSANMTDMAYTGQWNSATTTWSRGVHASFNAIFRQSRLDKPVRGGAYRVYQNSRIRSVFFPRPRTSASYDPVMRILRHVHCTGATSGGSARGRTRIRVMQYAIYDKRGIWIAKRLRSLWNAGCDVKIVYSAVNRPVFDILRSRASRGPIPMRQSVIRNRAGQIVKYNHNKWMTISGHWGNSKRAYVTFSGSANWSNLAFTGDEQMQQINDYRHTRAHLDYFGKVWRQRSSGAPRPGALNMGGRAMPENARVPHVLTFGRGEMKFMTED